MSTISLIAALLITAGPPTRGDHGSTPREIDAGQALFRLEREWGEAIVRGDVATLDRILAEDHVLTTPEGQVVSKAQLLEFLRSPRNDGVDFRGVDHEKMSARFYGNTAVVIDRFTTKVFTGGRYVDSPFQHTDVFVKQDGGWRCVARHATRVADPNDRHAAGVKPARGGDDGGKRPRRRPTA